jgi:Integrase core domain
VNSSESFNGNFRDECFNEHWIASIAEARTLTEARRIDYNTVRPHGALAGQTPQRCASFSVDARRLTSARADWKDTKNEKPQPENLSLSVWVANSQLCCQQH